MFLIRASALADREMQVHVERVKGSVGLGNLD